MQTCEKAKVKITFKDGCGAVEINGVNVPNATAVDFSITAGEIPSVTIKLFCLDAEIESDCAAVQEV